MPATDLTLLIDAAREAGKIATGFSGKEAARWDKPDDAGPVTEADLAVNDMLEERLRAARPDYGWPSGFGRVTPWRMIMPGLTTMPGWFSRKGSYRPRLNPATTSSSAAAVTGKKQWLGTCKNRKFVLQKIFVFRHKKQT